MQAQAYHLAIDPRVRAAQLRADRLRSEGLVPWRSEVCAQRPELPGGASALKSNSTSLTSSPQSIAASPQQRRMALDEDTVPVSHAPGRARTSRSASAQQRDLVRQPGPRPTTQHAARPRQASRGPPSAEFWRAAPTHLASASQPKQAERTRSCAKQARLRQRPTVASTEARMLVSRTATAVRQLHQTRPQALVTCLTE